ncbi:MAG: hypothetical protein GTO41_11845 [Burkholderiales bacterium]|nr:hypothetical protein [Burkholderiales bacterium]
MPNAYETVGRSKIKFSRYGKDAMGLKLSNAARVDLARSGTKDLLKGTMTRNKKLRQRQSTDSTN